MVEDFVVSTNAFVGLWYKGVVKIETAFRAIANTHHSFHIFSLKDSLAHAPFIL